MANEIERKFLVEKMPELDSDIKKEFIKQGYLRRGSNKGEATVRVRQLGNTGYLTIKGDKVGITQSEYEYEIPIEDAKEMFNLCEKGKIEKTRYYIPHGNHIIELDVFAGDNNGLIIAEIELESEKDIVEIPEWFGKEVTTDSSYSNAALSKPK